MPSELPVLAQPWLYRAAKKPNADGIVDYLLELYWADESAAIRRGHGALPLQIYAVWSGEPASSFLLEFGGRLFRVRADALDEDEELRLRLLSIHDADQQDSFWDEARRTLAADPDMESWLARVLTKLGGWR